MDALQKDFPDLSKSVLGDVLSIYKNDTAAAAAALKGIDEDTKRENQKKKEELQQLFPASEDKEIDEALNATKWDVDQAIVYLFNLNEKKQQEKKNNETQLREARAAEERQRREEEAKKQAQNLMEVFNTIPKEKIQQILDENEGDIEETTTQLLAIVATQEEEVSRKELEEERLKQEQEQRLRELKIQALEEKFEDLSEKVIYSENDSHSSKEVIGALEAAGWDIKKAYTELTRISASKRNNPIVVKKVQESLLERSMVIAQQVEKEVLASHTEYKKAINEESKILFRQNLEHIIQTQARHGVSPGMAPPLPKQIDTMLKKGKPIAEDVHVSEIEAPQKPPVQEGQRPLPPSACRVSLSAQPSFVDVGESITVSWEMLQGESSNYDWIGMFPVDKPNKQYWTYEWRGKNDIKKGEIVFTAPKYYGEYEFRYFSNSSYEHLAISNRIRVGPRFELSGKLERSKILVSWKQLSGNKYPRQWIGMYEKSQTDNKQYITWEYATSPDVVFDAPVKPGEYEFRFFSNSYDDIARSNVIKIEGEDKLSATISDDCGTITVHPQIVSVDPYYEGAWLGVFFTTETNNRQWRRYKYLTSRDEPVVFKAPRTPGTYEVRLFANKSYNCLLVSNSFVIRPPEERQK